MKNSIKTKTTFTCIFFLLLFSGCDSFLDTVPDNRAELNTEEKISQLLVSAYPNANYAAVNNEMADYVTARPGQSTLASLTARYINEDAYFWRDDYVYSTHHDSPIGFWNECYLAIAIANHALDAITKMPNPDALRHQRSEALLCRAFAHFLLVNLYANTYVPGAANDSPGVPYADEPETTVFAKYERNTVKYVYDRIEEDIEEALQNLPPDALFKVPAYHFTEKAALTFASRFYLYKGDYQKVIELTSRVVPTSVRAGNGNVPASDPANTWAATYFAAFKQWTSNAANIQAEFRRAENKHNFLIGETYSLLERIPSRAQYETSQVHLPASSTRNITGGYWPFTTYVSPSFTGCAYVYKFSEYAYQSSSSGVQPYVMFPWIRAEEVLLNRIEAEIHLDLFDAAVNDLNVYYRQRSGETTTLTSPYNESIMTLDQDRITDYWENLPTGSLSGNLANNFLMDNNAFGAAAWSDVKMALMLTLIDTRRAEYTHEGMRWFDVLRYKIPVVHLDMNNQELTLSVNDPRRIRQIPEVAVNFGLEPNPR
jgi:hypothetical protein